MQRPIYEREQDTVIHHGQENESVIRLEWQVTCVQIMRNKHIISLRTHIGDEQKTRRSKE